MLVCVRILFFNRQSPSVIVVFLFSLYLHILLVFVLIFTCFILFFFLYLIKLLIYFLFFFSLPFCNNRFCFDHYITLFYPIKKCSLSLFLFIFSLFSFNNQIFRIIWSGFAKLLRNLAKITIAFRRLVSYGELLSFSSLTYIRLKYRYLTFGFFHSILILCYIREYLQRENKSIHISNRYHREKILDQNLHYFAN